MIKFSTYLDLKQFSKELIQGVQDKFNINLMQEDVINFVSLHLEKLKQEVIIGQGLVKRAKK